MLHSQEQSKYVPFPIVEMVKWNQIRREYKCLITQPEGLYSHMKQKREKCVLAYHPCNETHGFWTDGSEEQTIWKSIRIDISMTKLVN